ncbi:uncharacterized protein L201_001193 [Kwoniella dendrophila CBS 6074]|uniref:RING-type domain-containing protein n=1 Tax=Kwoniella dendrophila CBS 6074 TaxID=1295534 RepID=A0AAX4JLR2_9TREE
MSNNQSWLQKYANDFLYGSDEEKYPYLSRITSNDTGTSSRNSNISRNRDDNNNNRTPNTGRASSSNYHQNAGASSATTSNYGTNHERARQSGSRNEETKSECPTCNDSIDDILAQAQNDNKVVEHSLWTCNNTRCGTMFCITCASHRETETAWTGKTTCPACRSDWDIEELKRQKNDYDGFSSRRY